MINYTNKFWKARQEDCESLKLEVNDIISTDYHGICKIVAIHEDGLLTITKVGMEPRFINPAYIEMNLTKNTRRSR